MNGSNPVEPRALFLTHEQTMLAYMAFYPDSWFGRVFEGNISKALGAFKYDENNSLTAIPRLLLEAGSRAAATLETAEVGEKFYIQEEHREYGNLVQYRTPIGNSQWHDSGGYQHSCPELSSIEWEKAEQMTLFKARFGLQLVRADRYETGDIVALMAPCGVNRRL